MTDEPAIGAPPDIVRRAVRDGLWNAAALGIPGVANVLIVAYLFRSVGPGGFAPWATVVAVLGLLTILDAGLSATTARHAARALAGDLESERLVRAAYTAYAGLGLAVFVLGVLAAPLIPLILGVGGDTARTAVIVCVVLSADLALVTGTAGWLGTLRGARRFDLICLANATQVAVAVPATILLVPALGLAGAAVAQLGGRLAGRFVAALAVVRTVPTIPLRPGPVARVDARVLGLFALPVLAIGISTQLGVGADPIIVALAAGPVAVGLYAAGSGLIRYGAFLLFPVLSVLLPSFAELGYSRPAEVGPVVLRCVRMAAAIGVIAFGSLAISGAPVLGLWIGRADGLSVAVLVLYALAHVAWVPSQILIIALIAAGRHGPVGVALLADAIVNVIASVVLVVMVGPIGVALSTFVALVAVHAGLIPLIAARRLSIPAAALGTAMAVGAMIGLAVVLLIGLVPADGLPGLLVRGSVALGAIVAVLAVDQSAARRRPLVTPQP
jgi:O-antigen/teichoic acid export membrane protein